MMATPPQVRFVDEFDGRDAVGKARFEVTIGASDASVYRLPGPRREPIQILTAHEESTHSTKRQTDHQDGRSGLRRREPVGCGGDPWDGS